VDAGAIGAGHAVTALYAIDLRDGFAREDSLGSIRLRWTEPGASRESSLTRDIGATDLAARFRDADPTLRLDAIVAATALAVRDGQAGRSDLRDILEVARQDGLPASDQADAFIDLLERLTELGR
jgi:Ca-activated chloride channel family protein